MTEIKITQNIFLLLYFILVTLEIFQPLKLVEERNKSEQFMIHTKAT